MGVAGSRIATPSTVGLAIGAVCLVSACVMGPDYVRPQVDVPQAYRFMHDHDSLQGEVKAPVAGWWQAFGDSRLDALVAEGLRANHDLRIAALRVDEFAARVTGARAAGLPQIGYGSSASRQALGGGNPDTRYSALLSASWEIDLWGRIRRESEAARASLLATDQARIGVGLTVASAIVSGYVTLLDLDQRLRIARSTVEGRRANVELFQLRLDGGVVSDFEMMQVEVEYEAALAAIPDIQRAIDLQENALSLLVGRNPGPIERGPALEALVTPRVPGGIPSQLLERRPDIIQSEQQLVAANATVGAARALYFPNLSLTGSAGGSSNELDGLFSGPGRSWSFVGELLGPIFSGGAIESANQQAEARKAQAVESYRRTVQNAFRDVDDALVSLSASRALVASYERRVHSLERAVELSRERYDNGYADYLDVLDSERGLFSARLALTAVRGDALRNVTDLYRALGGDWTVTDAAVPSVGVAIRHEGNALASPPDAATTSHD
ncbi:multidrug efflux system outer membrane protein [Pseudoxanthomonas sp. 3HH-4]|uniref:efflux transporter outer membrane subunit n=1 Tax=Pseudoxanthomonas sp. 3HH-4 TaxID=1690214 RepID=UPI0011756743|nr:efflux transporter outer membrane subunit [Pseudoxanthomonas sp. 3HH-4]TQM12104.1 multidrug efflux system outer membrane protein [Pseudoxanthomonas sp. 3HH-4]